MKKCIICLVLVIVFVSGCTLQIDKTQDINKKDSISLAAESDKEKNLPLKEDNITKGTGGCPISELLKVQESGTIYSVLSPIGESTIKLIR